ncbi:uncharacterized protein A4U43_C08F15950 [Asparagus officinalis]|nr:uncharacterized protein A4U43_C08F15950 [Asparagus officinalis]
MTWQSGEASPNKKAELHRGQRDDNFLIVEPDGAATQTEEVTVLVAPSESILRSKKESIAEVALSLTQATRQVLSSPLRITSTSSPMLGGRN